MKAARATTHTPRTIVGWVVGPSGVLVKRPGTVLLRRRNANLNVKKLVTQKARWKATLPRVTSYAVPLEFKQNSSWSTIESTKFGRQTLLLAWGDYFNKLKHNNFTIYLLTFQFKPLSDSERACLAMMSRGVQIFYQTLITRAIRKPRSATWTPFLPRMIIAPDLPVKKIGKPLFPEAKRYLNNGLHYHAVIAMSDRSRVELEKHLRDKTTLYAGAHTGLMKVHCVRVTENVGRIVDYMLKNVKRNRFKYDAVEFYPRAVTELPKKRKRGVRA